MTEAAAPRRRGAARSEAARLAIIRATATQFAGRGYDHMTIEGVAAEAGVAKQTIYRWWPSKSSLVAEALIEGNLLPDHFGFPDTGDFRADVTTWLENILRFIDEPGNTSLVGSLITASAENPDIAPLLNDSLGAGDFMARTREAVVAGDLAQDTPVQEIVDALLGAIVIQVLRRAPSRPGAARTLVDLLLH
ncbi:TetR/AcrR family transcriptional regulator [Myceligenerans halotolerans]